MFKQVFSTPSEMVTIYLEDKAVEVPMGVSVTAAMLFLGESATRTTGNGDECRGAFCLMGICYECLMEIDGVPNQQACLVTVKEGMRVRKQYGPPSFASREEI